MIIDVDKVIVEGRRREVDATKVQQLAESINTIGLITPIVIGQNKLIAGAHRLAAYKLLGYTQIACMQMGDTNDPDSLTLIEIDENLYRNELTPNQRGKQLALRREIMARRMLPKKLAEQLTKSKKAGELSDTAKAELLESRVLYNNGTKLSIGQEEVLRGAKRAAEKAATEEMQTLFGGKAKTHIQSDIKTAETLNEHNISDADRDNLSRAQLQRVAKAARNGGEDAAKEELLTQINKPKKSSVDYNNKVDETIRNLQTLQSGIAALRREIKKDNGWGALKKQFAEDIIEIYGDFSNVT